MQSNAADDLRSRALTHNTADLNKLIGCHPINSSCCTRVKTLKPTLANTKSNLILISANKQITFYHKKTNHVTVSDERNLYITILFSAKKSVNINF